MGDPSISGALPIDGRHSLKGSQAAGPSPRSGTPADGQLIHPEAEWGSDGQGAARPRFLLMKRTP